MAGASELDKAVEKLTTREKGWAKFRRLPAAGARPGTVTTGRPSTTSSTSSSPFAEKDYAQREHYADRALTSSDGVFTLVWSPIKSILLEGNVRATFKEPPA